MPRIAYINGQYLPHHQARTHIEDRGFQFADGVYEVIAVRRGALLDERGHLDRLWRSLAELQITPPMGRRSFRLVMREMIRRNRGVEGGLYIQVTRGVAARDFTFPADVKPTLVMTLRRMDFDLTRQMQTGIKVVTVPDLRWPRRDIKTIALLPQVLAKQVAALEGGAEAWMVDEDGYITEGGSSNAWILTADNVLVTRQADNSILKGVTRTALLALLSEEGVRIEHRAFTPEEAVSAKEAFTSGATTFCLPVVAIDEHQIGDGTPGPFVTRLRERYTETTGLPISEQQQWKP
ncbi:MAG: D-amino-acid transaminase [Alphaproteobacteria bacterium]